jgi:hypothetical protein
MDRCLYTPDVDRGAVLMSCAKSSCDGTTHCFGRNVLAVGLSAITVLIWQTAVLIVT